MTAAFPYFTASLQDRVIVFEPGEYHYKTNGEETVGQYMKTPLMVIEYPKGRIDLAKKEAEHQYLDPTGKDPTKYPALGYKDYFDAIFQDRDLALRKRLICIQIRPASEDKGAQT